MACSAGGPGHALRRDPGDECRRALMLLARAVREGPPRRVMVSCDSPVVLFTDGACEPRGDLVEGTIGGVLLDLATGAFFFFWGRLAPAAMASLVARATNPIATVELIVRGVVAARLRSIRASPKPFARAERLSARQLATELKRLVFPRFNF